MQYIHNIYVYLGQDSSVRKNPDLQSLDLRFESHYQRGVLLQAGCFVAAGVLCCRRGVLLQVGCFAAVFCCRRDVFWYGPWRFQPVDKVQDQSM